jgi:hypothetical protein
MKQTAVEQLGIAFRQWQKEWDNYDGTKGNKPASYDEFIEPFLETEKQQIIDAYQEAITNGFYDEDAEEYYNEKFNK